MGEPEPKENTPIQTLMDLGLTNCQARIYLSLVQNGNCSAEEISETSKVSRQDVYRVMPKIEELGLARKIIDNPVSWEATPIKDGLALLMDAQSKRYLGLQARTTELLNNFREASKEAIRSEKEPEFVILPSGKQQVNWWIEKIENLQTNWDGFTKFEGFGQGLFLFGDNFQKALDKGIKIRNPFFTTENKKERKKAVIESHPSFKHPNAKARFIQSKFNIVGMIFDGKEVCLCTQLIGTTKSRRPTTAPFLWSKNPVLVTLIQNYYNTLWNQAQEFKS